MGNCFYCRPQTLVTEDPNVTMFTKVGFGVLMGQYPGDFTHLTGSRTGGLAYVKNTGHLCLESTCGKRLCCLCSRDSWKLSDITQVEVVTGSITLTVKGRHGIIHQSTQEMNPGLGVILKNGKKIVLNMPDAVNFCARLRQCCNLPSIASARQLILESLLWQAIMEGVQTQSNPQASHQPNPHQANPQSSHQANPQAYHPANPQMGRSAHQGATTHPGVTPIRPGTLMPYRQGDTQPLLT